MKDMMKAGADGFPRLLCYDYDAHHFYIVMESLGRNLRELRELSKRPGKNFSVKTVAMIGLQLIQRLEVVHKYGYVHRDLKPANVLIGKRKSDLGMIFLIDFGLTKKEAQKTQVAQAPAGESVSRVVGTAIYAGLNAHLPGSNYYKKDDIESMMYVLVYLALGTLPWKGLKTNEQGLERMLKLKLKVTPEELCHGLPKEFSYIIEHIKMCANEAPIDYRFLESIFKQLFTS